MRAIVFPGQGSQYIGMGKELYDTFTIAKETFQEIDETLKQNLSKLMFTGDMEELTTTSNAQPAIMAVSLAAFKVIEKNISLPMESICKYLAGHSLGEYSAYTAAGSFSIKTTAMLLKARGQAMESCDPNGRGAMLALVGVEYDQALKLCEEVKTFGFCQIANDNGAGQIVLSGLKPAIEKATEFASQFGIKRVVKLNVSSAFHSRLMEDARKNMEAHLNNCEIKKNNIEVISNLKACPIDSIDEIKLSLVDQITHTVRWRETMEFMYKYGITEIIEVGPGKVLASIAKRMYPDLQTSSISTPNDIEEFLKQF